MAQIKNQHQEIMEQFQNITNMLGQLAESIQECGDTNVAGTQTILNWLESNPIKQSSGVAADDPANSHQMARRVRLYCESVGVEQLVDPDNVDNVWNLRGRFPTWLFEQAVQPILDSHEGRLRKDAIAEIVEQYRPKEDVAPKEEAEIDESVEEVAP